MGETPHDTLIKKHCYNVGSVKNPKQCNNVIDQGRDEYRNPKIENIAHQLVEKFGNSNSWKFYCKVAKHLEPHQIWNNYELSQGNGIKNPGGFFNWKCRQDMNQQ